LPSGDQATCRRKYVEAAVASSCAEVREVVVLGDMNVQDAEVCDLCERSHLLEARYHGRSWGVPSNKFDANLQYRGTGLSYDRVLFAGSLWVEAHLIGEARRFFDGAEFCLSDHFGLLSYVDVHNAYSLGSRSGQLEARARRLRLVSMKDLAVQKEAVESKALLQLGREEQVLARQRAAQRDRGDFQNAQRKAAKERADRRRSMQTEAFGEEALFGSFVVAVPAVSDGVPCAPQDVLIRALSAVPRGTWSSACRLPQKGLTNIGNTCFANAAMQMLLRLPAFVEWMNEHCKRCDRHDRCVLCALHDTRLQLLAAECLAPVPIMALRLGLLDSPISGSLANGRQHDAVEFVDRLLRRIRNDERDAGRLGPWAHVQSDFQEATHTERIFGFVRETRRRCTVCRHPVTRSWYDWDTIWRTTEELAKQTEITTSELYLASCAPQTVEVHCQQCGDTTVHMEQARVFSTPNVFLMQVRRMPGPQPGRVRVPVCVEEQLDVPGLPSMELAGIVYHVGETTQSGHYTALCRGPQGGFWYYDDSALGRQKREEVGHIKPREVYLVAYCRRGGVAELAMPPAVGEFVEVVADEDMEVEVGAEAERQPNRGDDVDFDGEVDTEAAGGTAVPARAGAAGGAGGAAAGGDVDMEAAGGDAVAAPARAGAAGGAAASVAAAASGFPGAGRSHPRHVGPVVRPGGPRIVMGFGAGRIDDLRAYDAEMEANALERHAARANEGGRGRMRDSEDRDLDRSESAFSTRRR
jgi:hypothetical protein